MEFVENMKKINEVDEIKEIYKSNADEVPKILIWTFSKMIFENGHIHCDPHPGNICIRPNPLNPLKP